MTKDGICIYCNGEIKKVCQNCLVYTPRWLLSKTTNVYMTADDTEACQRIGKSKENSNKTIVHFINRKHCKCAFDSKSIRLPSVKLHFSENVIEYKNTLAFYDC